MKFYKYIPFTLSLALIILFASCASDNTTTVTFDLIRHDISMNKKVMPADSIVDRFLMLFSGKAWAKGWTSDYTTFTITISAADMTSITANIPNGATSYTIQVPSGSQRNFRLVTGGSTGFNVPKNWGGGANKDLAPGDDVKLTIRMLPLSKITVTQGGTGTLNLSWEGSSSINFAYPGLATGFNIYRAGSLDGPYQLIQSNLSGSTTSDNGLQTGKRYYYKVSVITTYGEGIMCDADNNVSL